MHRQLSHRCWIEILSTTRPSTATSVDNIEARNFMMTMMNKNHGSSLLLLGFWMLLTLPGCSSGSIAASESASESTTLLGTDSDNNNNKSDNSNKKCSIFIAPSSLKNSAGYGVYTTRDIAPGEPILSGPPQTPDGPSLPVINPRVTLANPHLQPAVNHWNQVFDHYWWGRGVPAHTSFEAETVLDYQITFGALPNHHCVLASLDVTLPASKVYDDTLANRYHDPGAGAFSYHKGRIFVATHGVLAGQELFLSYGYCNRQDENLQREYLKQQQRREERQRQEQQGQGETQQEEEEGEDEVDYDLPPPQLWHPAWTKYIPMQQDFQAAEWAVIQKWKQLNATQTNNVVATDGNSNTILLDYSDIDQPHVVQARLTPHAQKLLPQTLAELQHTMTAVIQDSAREHASKTLAETATAHQHDSSKKTVVYPQVLQRHLARQYGTTPRTPAWIEEHGLCIEHLIPGKSVLPHAGQGAMAQHFIGAGEIIVPVPLLHITDKTVLNMTDGNGQWTKWQQLLLNYCFSHAQSSMALCPASNAILINHCSERMNNCPTPNGKPNADYQWASDDWDPRTKVWLNKTIADIAQQEDRILALEIVATQDIQPQDEVFIDYGPEWEAAWQRHVKHWKPPPMPSSVETHNGNDKEGSEEMADRPEELAYFSVAEANLNDTAPLPHLVSNSIRFESNHPHIFTGCLYWPTELDQDDVFHHHPENVDFDGMADRDLVNQYGDDGNFYRGDYSHHADASYWPCSVLVQGNNPNDNDDEEVHYVVRISQHHLQESQPWNENDLPRFLYHYPRSSIRYFVKPYESDVFLEDTFRHPIHIRSEIWPEQWRNLQSAV